MTKIIAIEGIDGTGKSVQLENLFQRLTARGFKVKEIAFPIYASFFGGEVGKLLTAKEGISAADVDAKSMALWFALDRFEAFQTFDYSDADVLLINRYVLSNAVYQSIRDRDLERPDLLDFIWELEHRHFKIPEADAYIVLDMDPGNAAENVSKKGFRDYVGNAEKDVYEAADSIQLRARKKYQEYAKRLANIEIINCMENGSLMSIEKVGHRIDLVVERILNA